MRSGVRITLGPRISLATYHKLSLLPLSAITASLTVVRPAHSLADLSDLTARPITGSLLGPDCLIWCSSQPKVLATMLKVSEAACSAVQQLDSTNTLAKI